MTDPLPRQVKEPTWNSPYYSAMVPSRSVEFGERTPAFAHNRVIVLGPYDEADAARDGAPSPRVFASETVIVTSEELGENPSRHASEALGRLGQTAQRFWLHVDLEMPSGNEFPAVDYPDPRGLTFTQLRDVLSTAFASPELLGASVVILNPNRDPTGGQAAIQVTKLLARCTSPSAPEVKLLAAPTARGLRSAIARAPRISSSMRRRAPTCSLCSRHRVTRAGVDDSDVEVVDGGRADHGDCLRCAAVCRA